MMNQNIYLCIRKKDEIKPDLTIEFPSNIKREESKKAYTLLKIILKQLNKELDMKKIKISEYGKPYNEDNTFQFNYSHSKNYIACAVSTEKVGIDIEDEFIISQEANDLYLHTSEENAKYHWVMKEAYFKWKEKFTDKDFKNCNIETIPCYHYIIENEDYTCIVCYENKKNIIRI